jgi:sigma-B regulation protein RsbU (phosphoserine phosphatase)
MKTEMNEIETDQTVLIVDDRPEKIRLISDLLEGMCRRMAATNGAEALQVVRRSHPDLILLDVVMPGMDGYEVCRRLQGEEETRNIPIIFVTSRGEVKDEKQGLELGAVDYISEPVKPAILTARVRTHLELKANREMLQEERAKLEKAHDDLSRAMDRLQSDIEVAGEIQGGMLPLEKDSPFPDAVTIIARYEPEMRVGGDFFDFKAINGDRLAVGLADVCGHGLHAAFLTGLIKTSFVLAENALREPSHYMERLNGVLYRLTPPESYATMLFCTYDDAKRCLCYVNAGHRPLPVFVSPGEPARALSENSSMVLGLTEELCPVEEVFEMPAGSKLVLTTDGVTETYADGDETDMFGYERLLEVIDQNAEASPTELDRAIHEAVCRHRGDRSQTDDIATLCLEFH